MATGSGRTAPRPRSRGRRPRRGCCRRRAAKPRSAAVAAGSSGSDEPASAPAPSGDTSRRADRRQQPVDVAGRAPSRGPGGGGPAAPAGPAAGGCSRAGRRRPRRRARSSSTCCRATMRAATTGSSSLHQSRRSVATWSLRLRPVWRLGAGRAGELGDPPLDGGVDVLVASARRRTALGQLGRHLVERVEDRGHLRLGRAARPAPARRTWACEPAMSWGHSRRSNGRLTVKASSSSAGPAAKRPCQSVAPGGRRRRLRVLARRHAAPGRVGQAGQARSCAASRAPPTPSSATHSMVSSPATVPSTPARPDRSSAEATTWAEPGGVRRTTRVPRVARPRPPTRPAPGGGGPAARCGRLVLRDGVDALAARHPDLDRAEVVEVAGHGGLGRVDALARPAARPAGAGS